MSGDREVMFSADDVLNSFSRFVFTITAIIWSIIGIGIIYYAVEMHDSWVRLGQSLNSDSGQPEQREPATQSQNQPAASIGDQDAAGKLSAADKAMAAAEAAMKAASTASE